MESWLSPITAFVNVVAMAISLWLGLYIVTRGFRTRVAWLAAFTLWSVASWFLHNLLRLSLPNEGALVWLGEGIRFAAPFWFHLSCRLYLDTGEREAWARRLCQVGPILAYAVMALFALDSGQTLSRMPSSPDAVPALLFSDRVPAPSYPLFFGMLAVLPLLSIWAMHLARRGLDSAPIYRQVGHLQIATGVAYVGGIYASLGIWQQFSLPAFPGDLLLGSGIAYLGFAVAQYNALIVRRPMERDALYSGAGTVFVAILYGLVGVILVLRGHASLVAVWLILVCVILSHVLYDAGRSILDRLFYRGRLRQLRGDLRELALEAGAGGSLGDQLHLVLSALRRDLGGRPGAIAMREENQYVVAAASDSSLVGRRVEAQALTGHAPYRLNESFQSSLPAMTTVVPLHAGGQQVGALVLGNPERRDVHREEDLEYLEAVGHQLAAVVRTARQQEERVQELDSLLAEFREREGQLQQQLVALVQKAAPVAAPDANGQESVRSVEDALRHLHDYAYLGEHPLAKLKSIERHLTVPDTALVTHVDRGKAVYALLVEAIGKLRPDGAAPGPNAVAPREWHAYLILHDAYVLGELNRDVMSRLYIGEGTYNRTRRDALRSLAKIVREMEHSPQEIVRSLPEVSGLPGAQAGRQLAP